MDIIEEGINGYLVEIEDFRGLAEKAIQILEMSGAEWKKMSDAAYDTATRYTWDDATLFFEKALEAAIERARRGEIAGCPIDR
jgi:glycosyltransferase involved in cell wall biosynthesis